MAAAPTPRSPGVKASYSPSCLPPFALLLSSLPLCLLLVVSLLDVLDLLVFVSALPTRPFPSLLRNDCIVRSHVQMAKSLYFPSSPM